MVADRPVILVKHNVISDEQLIISVTQSFVGVVIVAQFHREPTCLGATAGGPAGNLKNVAFQTGLVLTNPAEVHNSGSAVLILSNVPAVFRRSSAALCPGLKIICKDHCRVFGNTTVAGIFGGNSNISLRACLFGLACAPGPSVYAESRDQH